MIRLIDELLASFATFMWGTPLLILLLGGGTFFTVYSGFLPFRYIKHGINILFGKYDDPNDPGQINHFQALSSALASTVGMGNISGVAVAIHTGGPGALFWMWISAIVGMSTKFYTCTLSTMYRGKDDQGELQGGPMYVILEGLPKKYNFLAYLFSISGLFGCLALFQANQLTQIIKEEVYKPFHIFQENILAGEILIGCLMAIVIGSVIFGGIKRIGQVASRLVPSMVIIYVTAGLYIILSNFNQIGDMFFLIIHDAFTGESVLGGAVGAVIVTGIRRAAFSNEAGIGTESMAHGAAMTNEPVREGLVAMLGPMIDTLIVCTFTGFIILLTGVWANTDLNGITMTSKAFSEGIPYIGGTLLLLIVIVFSLTTMIGYSYYGSKCASFLFGTKWKKNYRIFYIVSLMVASVISIDMVVNFVDGLFAVMAIPTVISTILLAPKVNKAAKTYFLNL